MRTSSLPIALILASCLRPEADIDRTRIIGFVRADPDVVDEGEDTLNANPLAAVETEPLGFGYRLHTGALSGFGQNDDGNPAGASDTDCWNLTTPVDRGLSDDGAPAVEIDITIASSSARALVRLYDLEELQGSPTNPRATVIERLDVVGWSMLTVALEGGHAYAICISGLEGEGEVPYEIAVSGRHPDEAGLLVGIYTRDDPADRGLLLAGTNAQAFTRVDRWSYQARYEMLFVRQFQVQGEGDDEEYLVDENVKGGYLFAASLANLSQKLPAGTWHSSAPVYVDLTKKGEAKPWGVEDPEPGEDGEIEELQLPARTPTYPTVEVPDAVVVDAIAPMVIGFRIEEEEPNDLDLDVDPPVPEEAQDLGTLSGPGFVDIITGAIRFDGNSGSWDNDVDAFRFEVPAELELWFTLDWQESAADLDILILDDAGEVLDFGYYGHPEINEYGTGVLEPGRTYYAVVLLWDAPGPAGTEYPWELRLEQTAP